jgi:uncharacterized RDD family membrane protein YckC
VILFSVEVMYYSIMKILPLKATWGYACTKIRIFTIEEKPLNLFSIIVRNCIKTFSRYLFAIPFFTILFANKKQTLYDLATKIVVVQNSY